MTARVRFLTNNLVADLACKSDELKKSLEQIGVYTPLNAIKLDNARTLQVELNPTDEVGELIYKIVSTKSDTLGSVQRICRHMYCFSEQNRHIFISKLQSGEIDTIQRGIKFAEKLREEKNIQR